ncbi:MAG: CBS domain-containing protein, partial [Bacteriovoracaceae bacterium]|nr:CBS domain-containing protein [Bacteriovoracaceae bacterium]
MSLVVAVQGKYLDLPSPERLGPARSRATSLKDIQVSEDEGSEQFNIPKNKPNRFKQQITEYKKQEESFKKDHSHIPRIRDIMSRPVKTLSPEDTVQTAWDFMNKNQIRHIPLIEENKIVGLVTQTDILPN